MPPPERGGAGSGSAIASWMDEVRSRLRARPHARVPEGGGRRAGVLAPLFVKEGGLWVLFTRRADNLERHSGQIAFPGGAEEEGDDNLYRTALRESEEEIGLKPEDARYLGALSPLTTVTDFYVESYVAAIPYPYPFRLQESEIAGLIEAPIAALMRPGALEERPFPGRDEPVLFYTHGETVIWGATARMLRELLDALK